MAKRTKTNPTTHRVAIYARVSTTDQTCEQQLTALREYCSARGWPIEGEYVDNGVSGTKAKRPALDRLMEAARRRSIDAIVVWKMDRWGRSMTHFVTSVQELDNLGVRFVAVTQSIDTDKANSQGRLMMNILAAFADFEHELISERTLAGMERARRNGTRSGNTIGRQRKVIDRVEIRRLQAEGKGTREIAAELGVSHMTVFRILKLEPAA